MDVDGRQPQIVFSNVAANSYANYRSFYRQRASVGQQVRAYEENNGVNAVNNIDLGATNGVAFKAAYAYQVNNFAGSVNGGTVVTDTSGQPAFSVNRMGIGIDFGPAAPIVVSSRYKKIAFYPARLSDAQLAALTTN
jgi:hypothetical protein